jgi:hypothetical protein
MTVKQRKKGKIKKTGWLDLEEDLLARSCCGKE